jgi:hypothetical protein
MNTMQDWEGLLPDLATWCKTRGNMAKLVLAIGAVLLFISLIYVPWRAQLSSGRNFDRGYAWIWSPPDSSATVDYGRIFLEAAAVVVLTGAVYFLSSKRNP